MQTQTITQNPIGNQHITHIGKRVNLLRIMDDKSIVNLLSRISQFYCEDTNVKIIAVTIEIKNSEYKAAISYSKFFPKDSKQIESDTIVNLNLIN